MHLLPRVAELEERFAGSLVVIGVHSGKYPRERKTEAIRVACARLGVRHPVVNDRHVRVWRSYAVEAWPTVALVSPDGYLIGEQAGEFDLEPMAEAIAREIARYRVAGMLREGREEYGADPLAPAEPAGTLRFPTRLLASGDRLYVSDAGHHRVLELRPDASGSARVVRAFGDGVDGLRDGASGEARFREPQGLALRDGVLYVADRAAHAVRSVSLATGEVTTVAGTGELGAYRIPEGRPGRDTPLRSPWGLAVADGTLLVAMAGSHQLWSLDLAAPGHPLALLAGTGGENIVDGRARDAALAQPSGLALDAGRAYFADAESSSMRWVSLERDARVGTVVGTGLFEHGDRDGAGDQVLLQHDLDVAAHGGVLLVADTYNSKIKRLDPASRRCEALPGEAGSGEALWEPGGIHAGPEGVFVADTGHHRVLRLTPDSGALEEIRVAPLDA